MAAHWYAKAAEQGLVNAQTFLAYMYEEGRGIPKDEKQAAAWYQKAADQGEPNAQRNLGLMYADGRGDLPKDDALAIKWYRKAADQGDLSAQNLLGIMYEKGRGGLPQDVGQALYWYRKAADKGYASAQNNAAIILLMSHNPDIRSPRVGLDYARRAVESSKYNVIFLITLAEAYYVDEQFDKAVETIQRAAALAPPDKKDECTINLQRYQQALDLSKREARPVSSFPDR